MSVSFISLCGLSIGEFLEFFTTVLLLTGGQYIAFVGSNDLCSRWFPETRPKMESDSISDPKNCSFRSSVQSLSPQVKVIASIRGPLTVR